MYSGCEQGNGGTILVSTTLKNDKRFIKNVHHTLRHNNIWTMLNTFDQCRFISIKTQCHAIYLIVSYIIMIISTYERLSITCILTIKQLQHVEGWPLMQAPNKKELFWEWICLKKDKLYFFHQIMYMWLYNKFNLLYTNMIVFALLFFSITVLRDFAKFLFNLFKQFWWKRGEEKIEISF